jgi:hypothetical protein
MTRLCLPFALLAPAAVAAVSAGGTEGAGLEIWCGTIDMASYARGAPLNITVDRAKGTATANWRWDKDASGHYCAMKVEPGLKVVTEGAKVSFEGTDRDPEYYSLSGTLSGNTLKGTVTDGKRMDGHFTVTKGGAPVHKKCTAGPPPPPPPPPPHPTTHAFIWPLPSKYSNGTKIVGVTPSASFFKIKPSTSPLLTAAFERYQGLTFPHTTPNQWPNAVQELSVTVQSAAEDFPQLETYVLSLCFPAPPLGPYSPTLP